MCSQAMSSPIRWVSTAHSPFDVYVRTGWQTGWKGISKEFVDRQPPAPMTVCPLHLNPPIVDFLADGIQSVPLTHQMVTIFHPEAKELNMQICQCQAKKLNTASQSGSSHFHFPTATPHRRRNLPKNSISLLYRS